MGLDMYLHAKKYISKFDNHNKELAMELRDRLGIPPSDNLESVDLSFEVAYWRKANQIHAWFIENCADGVDECQSVYVERDKLKELLRVCGEVLASTKLKRGKVVNGYSYEKNEAGDMVRKANLQDGSVMVDHTVAEKLLPPSEGFFFGGTAYDQWYWQDIEYTHEKLSALLNNPNLDGCSFEYHASW